MKRFWAYALLVVLAVPLGVAAGEGALTPPKSAPFTATGGTVTQPVVFTGDNANGTGTVRIRPSDEDTQLVICEASNNSSPEVCSSWQHYNSSTTSSASFYATNLYVDSAGASQVYASAFGSGYFQTAGTTTAGVTYIGTRHPAAAASSANYVLECRSTGATTATCTWGSGHTTTSDFRGPILNGGSATCNGSNAGDVCLNDFVSINSAHAVYTYALTLTNSTANASEGITVSSAGGGGTLLACYGASTGDADYNSKCGLFAPAAGFNIFSTSDVASGSPMLNVMDNTSGTGVDLFTVDGAGRASPLLYGSKTNCTDSAGAAACSAAPAGSFVVDNGTTSTVVSTTAVTANSQILIQFDAGLGTKLGVTCNTNATNPYVTARTAGTSFTVQAADPTGTDPACFSYLIIN